MSEAGDNQSNGQHPASSICLLCFTYATHNSDPSTTAPISSLTSAAHSFQSFPYN